MKHANKRVKTSSGFIFTDRKIRNSRSTSDCCCYFGFILRKYDINSYQWVLVANAEDGLLLIFFLENAMAVMSHDGQLLLFDFKLPFRNKSNLIKSNLIKKRLIN